MIFSRNGPSCANSRRNSLNSWQIHSRTAIRSLCFWKISDPFSVCSWPIMNSMLSSAICFRIMTAEKSNWSAWIRSSRTPAARAESKSLAGKMRLSKRNSIRLWTSSNHPHRAPFLWWKTSWRMDICITVRSYAKPVSSQEFPRKLLTAARFLWIWRITFPPKRKRRTVMRRKQRSLPNWRHLRKKKILLSPMPFWTWMTIMMAPFPR